MNYSIAEIVSAWEKGECYEDVAKWVITLNRHVSDPATMNKWIQIPSFTIISIRIRSTKGQLPGRTKPLNLWKQINYFRFKRSLDEICDTKKSSVKNSNCESDSVYARVQSIEVKFKWIIKIRLKNEWIGIKAA